MWECWSRQWLGMNLASAIKMSELAMAWDGHSIGDKNVGMSESAMARDELCIGKRRNVGLATAWD